MADRSFPYPKLHPTGQAYLRWDGRCVYFGKHGTLEADQKYWAWRNKLENGAEECQPGYYLVDLMADYRIAHHDKNLHQKLNAISDLGPLASLRCTEYSPMAFRKHRDRVAATGTRCARHVNDLMRLVQRAVRWGVSMGKVPLDVYSRLKTVDPLKPGDLVKQARKRTLVDRASVERTLVELAEMPAAMISLLLFTGARPGEICSMRASEVNKNGPHGTWVYRPSKHKTGHHGKRRFIAFGPQGQGVLAKWWPTRGDYFFPSSLVVGHYQVASLKQAVEHACKRAGVLHWTPYQLRHLRLTEVAVDQGLEVAAKLAGHGELGTTRGYTHAPDKLVIDGAA